MNLFKRKPKTEIKIHKPDIPDGVYRGLWSAHHVSIFTEDGEKHFSLVAETTTESVGVRGINIHCTIVVKDNVAIIKI